MKKILVVCQKRAALEVVSQRLGKIDLDKYVVFLEKEVGDKLKIYEQLNNIIETTPNTSTHTESNLNEISNKMDECVSYLSKLGIALRKNYFDGVTAHKLYSKSNGQYHPILDLPSINSP